MKKRKASKAMRHYRVPEPWGMDLAPGAVNEVSRAWFDEATQMNIPAHMEQMYRAAGLPANLLRTPDELEHLRGRRITATETLHRRDTAMRNLLRSLEISFEDMPEDGSTEIRTALFGLEAATRIRHHEMGAMPVEEQDRMVARDLSRHYARMLDDAIFEQLTQRRRGQREEVYGRSPAMSAMRHLADLARGGFDRHIAASIPLKTWFNHKEFELNGWKATLLETDEQITAEGDNMQHCFARSYRNRIAKEEYLGYHITPPEGKGLPKSGFTVGFSVNKFSNGFAKFQYDQVKGKKNDTHHCQNPELLQMIEHIDVAVNKKLEKPDNIETKTFSLNSPVDIVNAAVNRINSATA